MKRKAIVLGLMLLVAATAAFAASRRRPARTPSGVKVVRDVAYGADPAQRFDVYFSPGARNAPVILLVHGGGWRRGDKEMDRVVENKVARWVPRGFVVISTNYRMLPEASPAVQADDVALALATAQQRARRWGGDPSKFILMGHSAGAHLVALISADGSIAAKMAAADWLGTVILDSAALDVVSLMRKPHAPLYDRAFGDDPDQWRRLSPLHSLSADAPPMLVVCSSQRRESCAHGESFVNRARELGVGASLQPEDLSHGEINYELGTESLYTRRVEAFLRTLDPSVAALLR